MQGLMRSWRALAAGFCFLCFGVGGVLAGGVLILLLSCLKRAYRHRTAKACIHLMMRLFVRLMIVMGVIRVKVFGRERLQRTGMLILANHPSLIDVVLLMSLVKRPDCVVKAGLWRNPFTALPVRATGFISNATGSGLLHDAISSVESGNNLIIFPEGTRTALSGEMHFQRGAANIAVHGKIAITPVLIRVSEPMLTKQCKWYRPPLRRPCFEIHILDDLAITPLLAEKNETTQQVRLLTTHLEQFFCQELIRCGNKNGR